MFSNSSGIIIQGGTFVNSIPTNRTSRGMDLLLEWVATGAFHNSDELYDAPKCHPHTRVAVLDDIMKWVNESESTRDDFMLWLFGPAGAGKSAIAKRIAEIAADMGILIATFFFSRTSPTRSNKDCLIPTLAYQLAQSIPDTRSYIENAVEQDPTVFRKNILTQIDTLLIKPFQSNLSTQIAPSQKLIIIDGLDECNDNKTQVAILEALSRCFTQHRLPVKFLVVSRPETNLVSSFTRTEPLKSIHRRLALDDTYQPDDDIRLFFSDKFDHIRLTHPLRSTIPISWPTQETLEKLVAKSSGQFIYASTVVKFVESSCHRPTARLNIILGVSPPGRTNPFAELDALYNHLLSSVDDIHLTLRILGLYVMTPSFAFSLQSATSANMPPELFLSLEPGDIQLALLSLSSIATYDELSGEVEILHASLVDFLSDKHRSTIYYIDMASICTDFLHHVLQYVKVPDGIRAGDAPLFHTLIGLSPWVPKGQLRSEILNFDIDAFINASIRWLYRDLCELFPRSTFFMFEIWKILIDEAGPDDGDMKVALDQLYKSLESRLRIYQGDWRLQLLLTFAASAEHYLKSHWVPNCRCIDILLEMDDHHLHLVDQDALDLRHASVAPVSVLSDMVSRYVDGDAYASAALHCLRFLSNPPEYSESNECPEMGLIYVEWKETCAVTLDMLCEVLERANTSLELVEFIIHHDIHPAVQKEFQVKYILWDVYLHILAFLSRASVCINWKIISTIQRSLLINDKPSSWFDEDDEGPTPDFIRRRLDQCCQGADHRLVWSYSYTRKIS